MGNGFQCKCKEKDERAETLIIENVKDNPLQ